MRRRRKMKPSRDWVGSARKAPGAFIEESRSRAGVCERKLPIHETRSKKFFLFVSFVPVFLSRPVSFFPSIYFLSFSFAPNAIQQHFDWGTSLAFFCVSRSLMLSFLAPHAFPPYNTSWWPYYWASRFARDSVQSRFGWNLRLWAYFICSFGYSYWSNEIVRSVTWLGDIFIGVFCMEWSRCLASYSWKN